MLKLKKIQILGFKSFCDRTEVTLPGQGLAVVVGPNGTPDDPRGVPVYAWKAETL